MIIAALVSERRFQFTPLREGRRRCCGGVLCKAHFNSRPYARGDTHQKIVGGPRRKISIHAPTRGATYVNDTTPSVYALISIHAPTRGATPRDSLPNVYTSVFQFTPLREGRLKPESEN